MNHSETPAPPKVSVLVVTYNQADTIARTLDSILAQQCSFAFEIVVCNDASTDGTGAICDRYARLHPGVVRHLPNAINKGVVRNYYDGIRECRGEYIADLAGDDEWCSPTKLQRQADILDRNPGVVMVHTDWQNRDASTGALSPSCIAHLHGSPLLSPVAEGRDLLIPFLTRNPRVLVHTCTYMFRRQAMLRHLELDPDFFLHPDWRVEDVAAVASLCHAGKVAFIPEVTLLYTVGGNNLTSERNPARTFDLYLSAAMQTSFIQQRFALPAAPFAPYFRDMLHFTLMLAVNSGDAARLERWRSFVSSNRLPLALKSRAALALTSCGALWRTYRRLRGRH